MIRPGLQSAALSRVCFSRARSLRSPRLPRRPADLSSSRTPKDPLTDKLGGGDFSSEARDACLARLDALGAHYRSETLREDGDCVVAFPVRLYGLELRGSAKSPISFPDRPLIDCRLAERLADWLREAVSPLLRADLGSSLRGVSTGAGYECRTRNRDPGAKLSAHGLGLALDITSFELADRQRLPVGMADDEAAEDAVEVVRKSACGWFTTVLGPGSPDRLHESHLHVDMQPHGVGEGYRICE